MLPMGGTSANLPVDEELTAKVNSAAADGIRAIKVVVEGKQPKMVAQDSVPASPSFAADFQGLNLGALLEDGVPCVLLFRLADAEGTVPNAGENDWLLFCWTPEGAPARLKMVYASSRKTLKDAFPALTFKEMNATERSDATLEDLLSQTRGLTAQERYEAMSREEIDAERVKQEIAKEQKAAPKKLAGLVGLQIQPQPSFDQAIERLLAEDEKAVLATLVGPKREELSGEVLDGVARPSQLSGRLPAEEPCYVVTRPEASKLLLVTWLPEGSSARVKMACSTFKKSVLELLAARAAGATVLQAEVCEEQDLTDDLGLKPEPLAAEGEAEQGQPAAKPAGFKPPPGAFGGFALPGMGPPRR